MSQQKQRSQEPQKAFKCPPPQGRPPSLVSCSAPGPPCCGGCGFGSQRPRDKPRRACRKPQYLRGGTVYHIKEEECGD
uniref:Late cornified envelope 6A n=1 Tax=Sus scrofa TaxID=9823 RepID=A0A8W4F977_PIG